MTQDSAERSELLRKLRETPVPALVVEFPRRDLGGIPITFCRVEVLRHKVVDETRIRVAERLMVSGHTPEKLGTIAWEVTYSDAVARELVAQSLTGTKPIPGTTDTFPRLFFDGDELSDQLAPAEIEELLACYESAQALAHIRQETNGASTL